jgi:putative ABC transport system permease protein
MLKLTLRSLWSHKARVLLTAISVVVGVAFVSGAFILTDSFERSFDSFFQELNQGVDYRVRGAVEFGDPGTGDPVPADLVPELEAVPGVAAVEPGLQGSAVILRKNGDPVTTNGPPTLGVSWTGEESIGGTVLRNGRPPHGPDEVAIDQATFDDVGIPIGDPIQVVVAEGTRTFTLVGTVGTSSGESSFFGATIAAFDPETAQAVLDSPGEYTAIDIALADGADASQVKADIEAVLPSGVEVVTGEQVAKETSDQIGEIVAIFRWVLLGFAMVSLFVSAFLINNTFQIIVSQRMRDLALLRAVGASGSQVRRMIVGESIVIAAFSTVVGFFAGIGVAKLLTMLFNAAGAGFPPADTVIASRTIVFAVIVGFGVTLLATIVPAARASRIPPVAAMRPELAAPSAAAAHRRPIIGAVVLAVGAVLYVVGILVHPGGIATIIGLAASGAVLVFIGATMFAAGIATPVSRALGAPIAKVFKVPGQLAQLNAARTPRRTSVTAAALMVGVALVSAVGVIASSFNQSLKEQLGTSIKADFFFSDPSFQGFPEAFLQDLGELPELSAVSAVRFGEFEVDGGKRNISAVNGDDFGDIIDVDVQEGGFDGLAGGGLMVQSDVADSEDLGVGDTVVVTWKNGSTQEMHVVGTYEDASLLGANWMVDVSDFAAANPSIDIDQFGGARIADGVEIDAARAAIEAVADNYPQVKVEDQAEFRKSQEDQLQQVLSIVYGLLLFAVLIAVLGIMNTLALSVFERTREFGLLRAVGTTRRQLKRAVRWEAVIVSVFGALLGLVVGLPLGFVATKGMRGIGITTTALPVLTIVIILIAAILAGMLAAIWPARRAAKLDVLAAIATH